MEPATGTATGQLAYVVALLGSMVVAVPVFRRLGLGSVLGYLCAGLAIGPFGLGWFSDPTAILHVAELGVVMFLFVIGLEMRPTHLWSLRREIFGLGALQLALCALLLTGVGVAFGFAARTAFLGALGFVLTSTAVVMQLLRERGDELLPRGQKIVAILLFEDLMIVPLLALVAFLAPQPEAPAGTSRAWDLALAVASLAGLVAAGTWLLNPLFRLLAEARAREVMTAAALLVVLGAALLMERGGLSMAMGAFLAGVLLSESSFRHQLEADVEPFRGILLGLFFLAVGMSLDLAVVLRDLPLVAGLVLAMMVVKAIGIHLAARAAGSDRAEAFDRAVLMAQGGEFAFVLYAAADAAGVIDADANAIYTAAVVLSMALTPLSVLAARRLAPAATESFDGVESPANLTGTVLVVGFGRFGQVMSQCLLARGCDVTIIDTDVEQIRHANDFGFKIYYGDGGRLDVLRACGAGGASLIAVCVDDKRTATRIAELARDEFPQAKRLVRSYDRGHSLDLAAVGVDFAVRETFESALRFGGETLRALGVAPDEVSATVAEVRRRDDERFQLELAGGGLRAGRGLVIGNAPVPTPFTRPRREGRPLTAETAAVTEETVAEA